MTRKALAKYFCLHVTVISRHIKNGVPVQRIHDILESDMPRRYKKNYIYGLSGISEGIKDSFWSIFIGDKGFDYSYNGVIMKPFQKIKQQYQDSAVFYIRH